MMIKNKLLMMSIVAGLSNVFNPTMNQMQPGAVFSRSKGKPVKSNRKRTSKYTPHQGKQECARRVRQREQQEIKRLAAALKA